MRNINVIEKSKSDETMSCFDVSDLVRVMVNKKHLLHERLTRSANDVSWIDKDSVSVYFFDNTEKVLLYRSNEGNIECDDFVVKDLVVPVWSLIKDGEKPEDAAIRAFNEKLGYDLIKRKLTKVNVHGGHTAFAYFESDSFDDIRFNISKDLIFDSRCPKEEYSSPLSKGLYFCDLNTVKCLDRQYKIDSDDSLNWTLYRPHGSVAIYNAFQYYKKNRDDYILGFAKSSRRVSIFRYDIPVSTFQNIFWTIYYRGLFVNTHERLGKVGCSFECATRLRIFKYVPISSIPNINKINNQDIIDYKRSNQYDSDWENKFQIINIFMSGMNSGRYLSECRSYLDNLSKSHCDPLTN